MKLTAKEIADDVQQTFDNVSGRYRLILENRIRDLCLEKVNQAIKAYDKARIKENATK